MYYNIDKILTYEQPIKMVVGGRGIGKTYSLKIKLFKIKIKNPKFEIIWLYRYDTDITPEKVERWADDLPEELKDMIVCGERKVQWIDENGNKTPFITFVALSKYGVNKGVPYPNVELVVFDEFLVDNDSRYLKNEMFAFKQWLQSIFRKRKINVVMLANALTIDNPYFSYFGVKKKGDQEFFKNKKVVVQYPKNRIYENETVKNDTYVGLFNDEETQKYDIAGEFYFDTDEFISSTKPKNAYPLYGLYINKRYYTIYSANKFMWVCEQVPPQTIGTYSLLKTDIKPNVYYIPKLSQILLIAYANNYLWFSSVVVRNAIVENLK